MVGTEHKDAFVDGIEYCQKVYLFSPYRTKVHAEYMSKPNEFVKDITSLVKCSGQ